MRIDRLRACLPVVLLSLVVVLTAAHAHGSSTDISASSLLYDLGFSLDPAAPDKNTIAITPSGVVVPTPWGDVEATIVSTPVDRMLRVPLSPNVDGGSTARLQPYVTAGTRKNVDDDPVLEQARATAFSEDGHAGMKAGAGLLWKLDTNIELFGEYQFMRMQRDVEGRGALGPIGTSLDTSGFSLGLSIRY